MPMANWHVCHILPDNYPHIDVASAKGKIDGKPVWIIYYIVKVKGKRVSKRKSVRFPTSAWKASDARKHCQGWGGKFDKATSAREDSDALTSALDILEKQGANIKCMDDLPLGLREILPREAQEIFVGAWEEAFGTYSPERHPHLSAVNYANSQAMKAVYDAGYKMKGDEFVKAKEYSVQDIADRFASRSFRG